MTNESKEVVKVESVKGVDITPVLTEVVEYAKDQASVGDLESIISSVPRKDSLDWKLISGVLCNSIVEWIAEDKDNRMQLLHHMQGDVGYLLKRLGLAGQSQLILDQGKTATTTYPSFFGAWLPSFVYALPTTCG